MVKKLKKFAVFFIAALLSAATCLTLVGCGENDTFSRAEVVLGDGIVLDVSAKGRGCKSAVDEMFALCDKVFGEIDLSESDSTLSRFNADAAGKEYEIGKHTFEILRLADEAYRETGGAFDASALPLVKLWKADSESINALRPDVNDLTSVLAKSLPAQKEVERTAALCGFDKISYFSRDGKYYIKKSVDGAAVDLGGIAKGYFTDVCASVADDYSLISCRINLSGNLYLYGKGIRGGGDWSVGVVNPRPRLVVDEALRGHVAAVKCGGDRAFVSSGDYQRFYYYSYLTPNEIESEAQLIAVPHIVNVKTGLPIGVLYDEASGEYYNDFSNVCMATVSARNSAKCDAYATAVSVMGIERGAAFLRDAGYEGLIFTNPDEPYQKIENEEKTVVPTKQGKGKMAVVGDLQFIDGYDAYKSAYELYELSA